MFQPHHKKRMSTLRVCCIKQLGETKAEHIKENPIKPGLLQAGNTAPAVPSEN